MNNFTQLKAGRIIAVGLVLIFAGLVPWKSKEHVAAHQQIDATNSKNQVQRNTRNQIIAKNKKIEKLRYAYTGQWAKNDLSEVKDEAQKFEFIPAVNTRNNIQATAAKNKKKAKKTKKKKVAKKTKKHSSRYANRSKRAFDNSDQNHYNGQGYTGYFVPQNNPQERSPSDEEQQNDKASAQQWIELITQSKSGTDFIKEYGIGNVSRGTFYTVVESLLSSDNEDLKKIGFTVLGTAPSPMSLLKYAAHINDEMSGELKTYAQSTLSAYHSPNQLRTLNSLLSSSDSTIKIIAADLIRSITTSILQSNSAQGENVVYTEQQLELYRKMLTQSLNVINHALDVGVDGIVQGSFLSARTILVQFLS